MRLHDNQYIRFAVLILFFCGARTAGAQTHELPVSGGTTTGQSSRRAQAAIVQPEPKKNAKQEEGKDGFLDLTYSYLSRTFSGPAVWFDSFFGDERIVEENLPGTFVRWRNMLRWPEDAPVIGRSFLQASLRLPKLKKKLRLIITGEQEDEQSADSAAAQVDTASSTQKTGTQSDVGLRYELVEKRESKFDVGAGIRLRHLQTFARARYLYTHPLSASLFLRFSETAYLWEDDGFIETTRLDLERSLTKSTLVRFSNSIIYTEAGQGLLWTPGMSLFHQLTPKDAVSLDISANYVTRPETDWVNFRVGARYRKNFYRPWLFFEFEPEITWPRDAYRNRTSQRAVMCFLEVHFWR